MASSMLRGFLNIVVLKALAQGPKSGYALMKYIKEKIGSKPSPGSMYPLLNHLTKNGVIECKGVGRTKEYKLTMQGKHKLEAVEEKRNECMCNVLESMKMISALTNENISFPLAIVESVKKGEFPFKEVNPEWDTLRNQMFIMWKNGALKQKAQKVRRILTTAMKELKSL